MFIGTLVKLKFGMLQNYFCRNSKLLVDVDITFFPMLYKIIKVLITKGFLYFLDLSQEIHLIESET